MHVLIEGIELLTKVAFAITVIAVTIAGGYYNEINGGTNERN